jgi:4-amino-4-deoxy-L-arabinose transferase-like glycosyltransferase
MVRSNLHVLETAAMKLGIYLSNHNSMRWVLLVVIMLTGFGLRLAWMITETPVISMEGTEYVRMGENLMQGHGLIGNFEGPETMYAPLFSLLTAAMMLITHDAEVAGHLIALLFGTALIPIVFFTARHVYDERTAQICAALVAFHPLLVKLSASIYNESLYLTLFVAGIYFGIRALDLQSPRHAILAGAVFGLAYLSRPEAFAYPIFFALALCMAGAAHKRLRLAALGSALLLGTFLLVASPYIAFFYQHTGHFRMEGKWNINYTIAQRVLTGMNWREAAFGIDSDLRVQGPLLIPSEFADYTPFPHALTDKVRSMIHLAKVNKDTVYRHFVSLSVGSPAVLALAVLGLLRTSWNPRRTRQEAVLLVMGVSIVILLLTATDPAFRYFLPLVPLLLLWAGKGVDELGQWARGLTALNSGPIRGPMWLSVGPGVCAVALMIAVSAYGTRDEELFVTEQSDNRYSASRDAGVWLRQYMPGPKRVAAWLTVIPYYAEATLVQFPFANPELTRRYLDAKQVDFVVLESQYAQAMPTIGEWMARGIPDDHARLIYDNRNANGNRILIYSWETQYPSVTQASSSAWHTRQYVTPEMSGRGGNPPLQQ